jgi:hypothetical protein
VSTIKLDQTSVGRLSYLRPAHPGVGMNHFRKEVPVRASAGRGVRCRDVRSGVDAVALGLISRAARMDCAGAACGAREQWTHHHQRIWQLVGCDHHRGLWRLGLLVAIGRGAGLVASLVVLPVPIRRLGKTGHGSVRAVATRTLLQSGDR